MRGGPLLSEACLTSEHTHIPEPSVSETDGHVSKMGQKKRAV